MSEFEGWYWQDKAETGSTNDDAKLLAHNPPAEKFVATAVCQNAGRGRRGRNWIGMDGNLFMSLGIKEELKNLGQLVFVVSLSLADVISALGADVKIKWPNDVLVRGGKISGILMENVENGYIIIGIGVNIKAAPQLSTLLYRSASLKENGIEIDRLDFLRLYLKKFDENRNLWHKDGFEDIRRRWLQRAKGLGEEIRVMTEKGEESGVFAGVDNNGLLLLQKGDIVQKIYAGDVFYKEDK